MNLRLRAGDADKLWRFPYVDELDYARVLRDRSLAVIRGVLDGAGIPLRDFDRQVELLQLKRSNYDYAGEPR